MALAEFGEVRTARLLLRPVHADDLPALMDVNGDAEVTRHLPYEAWRGPDDAQAWLDRMLGYVAKGDTRQLVAVRLGDMRAVATILLFRHDEGSARAELGYALARSCWRQGYMSEALGGVLGRAFDGMGLRRIEAEAHPDNRASCALLEALGFRREGVLRERWITKGAAHDTQFYGLLAPEWRARAGGSP